MKQDGGKPKQNYQGAPKRKHGDPTNNKDDNSYIISGWTKSRIGYRTSPTVRHTLSKLQQLQSSEKEWLVPELQRALAVENIAANFVSSGNKNDMIQELKKIADGENTWNEPSPPKKKDMAISLPQVDASTTSAMMASSSNQAIQPKGNMP